ncbi:MAG: asparagine synthase (glutamine-hydrolyzing) [Hydrotalea sp.]|nr:asparagine synthase (glutamine-hydrolyzing) [Hydrotalea sp.]
MCGISGVVTPYADLLFEEQVVAMQSALLHRGPDGNKYIVDSGRQWALAHNHLMISPDANLAVQPFQYGDIHLIFNGAIYNAAELRKNLIELGCRFTTNSDTEVLAAALQTWHLDALDKLEGMFAIAFANVQERAVYLCRDKWGEKPLFYHVEMEMRGRFRKLYFASEMKALWKAGVPKSADGGQWLRYLSLGKLYSGLKKTDTFYNDILSLPPAHYIRIIPGQGKLQMRRWWRPQFSNAPEATIEDLNNRLKELLQNSVEKRIPASVKWGLTVSGGLDSSILAAEARELRPYDKIAAFSAVFPGHSIDESSYSTTVASKLSLNQYLEDYSNIDIADVIQKVLYHQEMPLQSSSVVLQYMLFQKAAQEGVKVLIDGQGADECWGGYATHVSWHLQYLFRNDYKRFQTEKKQLLDNGFLSSFTWKHYIAAWMPEKAAKKRQEKAVQEQLNHPHLNPDFYAAYYNDDALMQPVIRNLDDVLYHDLVEGPLQVLLRFGDRNAMAHGIELRLPYLSPEMVSFAFSIQPEKKINLGYTKWLLRQAHTNTLSNEIIWRKGKIGFEPPQISWMKQTRMQELIMESRRTLVKQGILLPGVLQEPLHPTEAHAANGYDWRYLCAALLLQK